MNTEQKNSSDDFDDFVPPGFNEDNEIFP